MICDFLKRFGNYLNVSAYLGRTYEISINTKKFRVKDIMLCLRSVFEKRF